MKCYKSKLGVTKKTVVYILIAVILGPLIIHILYKLQGPVWLVAEWSAGDLLQYYGMFMTALIAIGGLYLTFQDNRKGIREQSRLDQLPYFSLTTLNYQVRNPLIGPTTDKEIDSKGEKVLKPKDNKQEYYYKEEKLKAAILAIRKGSANIETKLSEADKKLIINGGIAEQRMGPGMIGIVNEPMTYVPILLRNVGKGAAIDFRVGFNNSIDERVENPQYLSSTSINVDEEFYLGFFAVHEKNENAGEYLLEVIYKDIFNNQYTQKTKFIVSWENDTAMTNMEVEFRQEMVGNEVIEVKANGTS